MRATIDNLDEAIMAELENWNEEIKRAVNEGLEETAAVAAKTLRQGGPYQERTRKYTKDWTHGVRQKRSNIAEMVRCQIRHEEKRCGIGKEQ